MLAFKIQVSRIILDTSSNKKLTHSLLQSDEYFIADPDVR